jgi:hypothetical protein
VSAVRAAITAGEWLVSPGERYAPYGKWSCLGCHVCGFIRDTRDEARDEAAAHVRATGHDVIVSQVSEEFLHGMALR